MRIRDSFFCCCPVARRPFLFTLCTRQAIKETVDSVQRKLEALSLAGKGGGGGFPECPLSLELTPEKTAWSTVFPLFGRLRRDASVEHLAGVSLGRG